MSEIKAMLFNRKSDGRGGFVLEPITTAAWLSAEMASTVLGVSRATVYRLIDQGDIPSHQIGGRKLISSEDLLNYIKNARTVAGERLTLEDERAAPRCAANRCSELSGARHV
jgi:excisionase family DNA binding protein